jgi:hypothetical protein
MKLYTGRDTLAQERESGRRLGRLDLQARTGPEVPPRLGDLEAPPARRDQAGREAQEAQEAQEVLDPPFRLDRMRSGPSTAQE